jgi:NADH:ubiquinone oxidoreductase subunit 6 (subunit J)
MSIDLSSPVALAVAGAVVLLTLFIVLVLTLNSAWETMSTWRTWYREALQNTAIISTLCIIVWAFYTVFKHVTL